MIKTEHLTKRYASLTAVDDVNFTVAPGDAFTVAGTGVAGRERRRWLASPP